MEYQVDSDIKQEFLFNKPTGTAEAEAYVMKSFDDYEAKTGKSVFNFNISELNEMFATLRNTSKRGAGKNKSILVNYIDFCVNKKIVPHMENRAKYIDIEMFVHRQALMSKYISREKLKEYSQLLYNEQDQLLLWLPFIGVRGRTVEDGTLEEIINLTIDDVFPMKNRLILRQNNGKNRVLDDVPDSVIDLIKDTYEQGKYTENNGELTNNPKITNPRQSVINKDGEFGRHILRIPGLKKYEKFTPSILNSRMNRIKKIVGNQYLSYTVLLNSGMLQMCFDILKEKGEVIDKDFDDICIRFNYGIPESVDITSERKVSNYWFNLKDLFNQYKELL